MASSTQSEQAYHEIRRQILVFEIRPEERLKEEEWARKLKVGRPAVREALTRLHGETLVTRGAKGGFFAAAVTPSDIHENRELREAFEVTAIRLAENRVTPEQIQAMENACDDYAYMAKKGYHVGATEADQRFHHLLVAASGNMKLVRAYDQCHIPLFPHSRQFYAQLSQTEEYVEECAATAREHREIVAALKAGATEKAIDLLRAHFIRGERIALTQTAREPRSQPSEAGLSLRGKTTG